jgi:hypothetical protein
MEKFLKRKLPISTNENGKPSIKDEEKEENITKKLKKEHIGNRLKIINDEDVDIKDKDDNEIIKDNDDDDDIKDIKVKKIDSDDEKDIKVKKIDSDDEKVDSEEDSEEGEVIKKKEKGNKKKIEYCYSKFEEKINIKNGKEVPYKYFSDIMNDIESVGSRIKKIEILANFFREIIRINEKELIFCVYLLNNQVYFC